MIAVRLLAVASMLLLSGCGAAETVLGRVSSAAETETPVATIGVAVPLSGGQTRIGQGVQAAVEQALADAGGVPGWQVEVEAVDIAGPDADEEVADLASERSVVAVVTGFEPDDVRRFVPVLDDAGITVLSPADADPRHVRGADLRSPLRPWSGYVTTAVDPRPEQSSLAAHLVRVAGVSDVLVVTDGTPGAQSRAGDLAAALGMRGVSAVAVEAAPGGQTTPAVDAALAELSSASALVVDGPPELAAALAQARPAGVAMGLMTRLEPLTAEQAGALDGAVAPEAGADPRRGGPELQAALEAAGSSVIPGPFGPAAYDGTRLLLDALSRCLPPPPEASTPPRSGCRAEVAGTQSTGLTGPIAFDEFGARLGLLPAVVSLRGGSWAAPGA